MLGTIHAVDGDFSFQMASAGAASHSDPSGQGGRPAFEPHAHAVLPARARRAGYGSGCETACAEATGGGCGQGMALWLVNLLLPIRSAGS